MAFDIKDLSVLAYANGFTLWHYRTADAAAAVDDAGYFDTAVEMLRTGDMILANTEDGAAGGVFRVASNTGTTVDVADMTAVGATDTD
ncbi:MAG: hypothetical protein GVY28_12915 [Alphaproteobacteria bacterium]|jgi:hypothetical protein|nr:hypothetical protein [Alphaproteobacteria bacterium]